MAQDLIGDSSQGVTCSFDDRKSESSLKGNFFQSLGFKGILPLKTVIFDGYSFETLL